MNRLVATLWKITRAHWGITLLVVVTVLLAGGMARLVIWPGYKNPISRMSTSRLGYVALMRQQGKPFPVTTARVEKRTLERRFLGEGLVRSEPIQVPVIPMARIQRVYVQEGQRVEKGQLLAELDNSRARIKVDAAKTAIEIAEAELERTRIGSAYVLDQERPERDEIRLSEFEDEAAIKAELARMQRKLYKQKAVSKVDVLVSGLEAVQARSKWKQTAWALRVATAGKQHSLRIAESAIQEGKLALAHREHELQDYKIYAPADGIIERCLIHEGEYNQDPGKPAFLIASGVWFDAYMDQTAIGKFHVGDSAEVQLEAFAGRTLKGRVTRIHPVVSFNLGGPETNRPIRPLGTGAPEWPATFTVQIEMDASELPLVPGLTGFARVQTSREGLAVPRSAVVSVSADKAMVFRLLTADSYQLCEVSTGFDSDGWVELCSGLQLGDEVIVSGHEILELGDRIVVSARAQGPQQVQQTVTELVHR